jgi:APA family basic amino acid/polyamine antiporter
VNQSEHDNIKEKYGLQRGFGLLQATALNMSNMVGIGPFITIPLIIASMGGPQCMVGWLLGTVLAICDGLIWSELAAAMPGSGGTYVYLREAFRHTSVGRLLPFLFIWQFLFSGPLEIASGYIGFAQYVTYLWRSITPLQSKLVMFALAALMITLLYRRVTEVARLTVILWVGMIITVLWIIVSGLVRFEPRVVFDFPPQAFTFSMGFLLGLGGAMRIAMYDFLGYYDICYIGGEVRNPERVLPRAIILSVVLVALIYSVMNLAMISVVPWREAMHSPYIAAEFMERIYGGWAGTTVTVLILWTSAASVFALILGYSRIPYAAALDGYFFSAFAKLHPVGKFPHVSLLVIGVTSILASLVSLSWVIDAMLVGRILIQFIGQIAAVHLLRTKRPDMERPFRMWLYPLPSLIALLGWTFLFVTAEPQFILFGLGTLVAGIVVFAVWRRAGSRVPA